MNYKLLPIYIYIILILIVLLLRFSYRIYKNNSKNLISANDIIFKDNKWENNYMFGLINYKESINNSFDQYIFNFLKRQKKWEKTKSSWYQKYKIKGIIQIDDENNINSFLDSLKYTKPPLIKKKYLLPYRIVFLTKNKNIVLLLNHFYCDGMVLHDIITENIANTKKSVNFFPYKYYPIYSDISLINFIGRHFYNYFFAKSKTKYLKLHDKSVVINKNIHFSGKIDRWFAFSHILDTIFKNISLKKKKLTVGITVGFEDNNDYCNNRIGVIILRIPRMKSIEKYTAFLKKRLFAKKNEALVTYDLLRNFPSTYLRTKFNSKIDVLLTTLKIDGLDSHKAKCEANNIDYIGGTFVGIGKIPIYALSMTLLFKNVIRLTLKINTPDFDLNNILNDKNTEIFTTTNYN